MLSGVHSEDKFGIRVNAAALRIEIPHGKDEGSQVFPATFLSGLCCNMVKDHQGGFGM